MKWFWEWVMKIFRWKRRARDHPGWEIETMKTDKEESQLRLIRNTYTDKTTIGDLSIEGNFFCYILEDPVREEKIPKITAIPAGRYEVIISYSRRWKRLLPKLQKVPNYTGIRFHLGNWATDTDGCLLPGMEKYVDAIGYSKKAFNDLFDRLVDLCKHEKVFIDIVNEREKV